MSRVAIGIVLLLGASGMAQTAASGQQPTPRPVSAEVVFLVPGSKDETWVLRAKEYLQGAAAGARGADVRFALLTAGKDGAAVASELNADPAKLDAAARKLSVGAEVSVNLGAFKFAAEKLSWSNRYSQRHFVVLGAPGQTQISQDILRFAGSSGYTTVLIPYADYAFPPPPMFTYLEEYVSIGPLGVRIWTDYATVYNLRRSRHQVIVPVGSPGQLTSNGTLSSIHVVRSMVIDKESEWKALWKEHLGANGSLSSPPTVDFKRYTIVAVFAGDQRTTGYYLQIRDVRESERIIDVYVDLIKPKEGDRVYTQITQPWLIQQIPKKEGKRIQVWYKG